MDVARCPGREDQYTKAKQQCDALSRSICHKGKPNAERSVVDALQQVKSHNRGPSDSLLPVTSSLLRTSDYQSWSV